MHERKDRTAWLAGATGLVGGFVLRHLLASEQYARVVVLTRRVVEAEHPKLEQRVLVFDQLPTMELPSVDDVFCALGTTLKKAGSQQDFRHVDLDFPLDLAKKAVASQAKQFLLVSSVGANSRSSNFYLRTKGELEDAVSALPFNMIHIFRPSMLVGPRKERRPGERAGIALMKLLSPLLVAGLRKYHSIEADEVARAMVSAAIVGGSGKKIYEYDQMIGLLKAGAD
jgi:uncharacterized protein YbjT (DUF2867 family)